MQIHNFVVNLDKMNLFEGSPFGLGYIAIPIKADLFVFGMVNASRMKWRCSMLLGTDFI